jgi:hypothetical protein
MLARLNYKHAKPVTDLSPSIFPSCDDSSPPSPSDSVNLVSIDSLVSAFISNDFGHIIQSLSDLTLLKWTPFISAHFSDLPSLLLTFLSETMQPDIHEFCFQILSNCLHNPDSLSNFPESVTFATVEAFRARLMDAKERAHELRLYHFLKFTIRLALRAIESYRFDRFISLLERCLDGSSHPRVVQLCYRLAVQILSHNRKTEFSFLDHEFMRLTLGFINKYAGIVRPVSDDGIVVPDLKQYRNKAFCCACDFLGRICINSHEVLAYLPDDIIDFCADILDICDDFQSEAFFAFLHGLAMNHFIFPLFFGKRFLHSLIGAISDRSFSISREAVLLLTTMMKEAPELMGDCISGIATLDGLARFFDTQSPDVGEIITGTWVLANRAVMTSQASLLSVFANSPAFVEQVERILSDSDARSAIAPHALDAAQMLMEALRNEFEAATT